MAIALPSSHRLAGAAPAATGFSFASQGASTKRLTGLGIVALLHVLVIYALVTGLARDVIQVIQKPLEARLIEEIKPPPPPPPPEKIVQPQRKVAAPPPPFVPPPEVQVQAPVESVIAVSTQAPPTEPVPPAAPAQAAPPAPKVVEVGVACPNVNQVKQSVEYPDDALRNNVTGKVLVAFSVGTNGEIKNLRTTASPHRSLAKAALAAARQLRCVGQGGDVDVVFPFDFQLN